MFNAMIPTSLVYYARFMEKLTVRTRHVDLKGNLIKAMMVINWLNMLEVEQF